MYIYFVFILKENFNANKISQNPVHTVSESRGEHKRYTHRTENLLKLSFVVLQNITKLFFTMPSSKVEVAAE